MIKYWENDNFNCFTERYDEYKSKKSKSEDSTHSNEENLKDIRSKGLPNIVTGIT